MTELDPHVDVAVLLDPHAVLRVQGVVSIGGGVEPRDGGQPPDRRHGQSLSRVAWGQAMDAEDAREVILVVVERAHRGRVLERDHRHQHLELQLLGLLPFLQHLAGAAKERIGGDVGLGR